MPKKNKILVAAAVLAALLLAWFLYEATGPRNPGLTGLYELLGAG